MVHLKPNHYELVGIGKVRTAISADASRLASKGEQEKFVEANTVGVYICVNTWFMLVKQVSDTCYRALLEEFMYSGLTKVITDAQECADEFLRTGEVRHALWREVLRVIRMRPAYEALKSVSYIEPERLDNMVAEREFLQLLRYPKRFSWNQSKVLERNQLKAFTAQEDENSKLATHLPSEISHILQDLRTLMMSVIDWDRVKKDLTSSEFSDDLLPLTPGVAKDAATMSEKIRMLARYYPDNFPGPFATPTMLGYLEPSYRMSMHNIPVRIACVPKSYKAYRTIAPEPIARGSAALQVMRVLERYLPRNIPLHDQSIMTERARIASIDGEYSTLDLSAASDCVTKWLVHRLVPSWFWSLIEDLIPWYVDVDGRVRRLRSFATMGNPLTFVIESLVFYVIDLYAIEVSNIWHEERASIPSELPWVYGDDQIVPTYAAETVIDVLTRLGFKVNREKSFFDPVPHAFRESCGGDYWDGYEVSTLYWPRRVIDVTIEEWKAGRLRDKPFRKGRDSQLTTTASVLVALEQRLFRVNLDAAMFVLSVLWLSNSDITTDVAGTSGPEPWGLHYDDRTCASAYGQFTDIVQKVTHECPVYRTTLLPNGCSVKHRVDTLTWVTEKVIGRCLKGIPCPEGSREPCGYAPTVRAKPVVAKDRAHVEEWYIYQYFLAHGPYYPTPLDELLGVSKSWFSTLVGEPKATVERRMR